MSGFAAVDLDAVLDDFEEKEEEKNDEEVAPSIPIKAPFLANGNGEPTAPPSLDLDGRLTDNAANLTLEDHQENGSIKEEEPIGAKAKFSQERRPKNGSSSTESSIDKEEQEKDEPRVELEADLASSVPTEPEIFTTPDEESVANSMMEQETKAGDVKDDTDCEAIDSEEALNGDHDAEGDVASVEEESAVGDREVEGALSGEVPEQEAKVISPPSSGSASPPFDSIYDSGPVPSDTEEPATNPSDGSVAVAEETSAIAAAAPSSGARPKQTSRYQSNENQVRPIPPESPPPYSEVDPMENLEHERRSRPSNLDLPSSNSPAPPSEVVPEVQVETEAEIPDQDADEITPAEAEGGLAPPNGEQGPAGSTPNHPNLDANLTTLLQGLTEDQLKLGENPPLWVPDAEAPNCMICDSKFTLVRRRHHCRACGKVLCNACCNEKAAFKHLDSKVARVCKPCKSILDRIEKAEVLKASMLSGGSGSPQAQSPRHAPLDPSSTVVARPPNPNNPMEYCSTVPPLEQAGAAANPTPSVLVPVSVLKHSNSEEGANGTSDKKVMFSDGVRPGGDLAAELDGAGGSTSRKPSSSRRRSSRKKLRSTADVGRSLLPVEPEGMPIVRVPGEVDAPKNPEELMMMFLDDEIVGGGGDVEEAEGGEGGEPKRPEVKSVQFVLNKNLIVFVSSVIYSPANKMVWSYRSEGLASVGQNEVVFLFLRSDDETLPPRDVFDMIQSIYEHARSGNPVYDMGYVSIPDGRPFLRSSEYGGFLFVRPTFQSLDSLGLPVTKYQSPYLFAILITRWEVPWARIFPLRLKLRLGAHARYYPCPLWSDRSRDTVYRDIGNTIMNLLSDFRNFTYSLPIIRGLFIHMEDKVTTVCIPKEGYRQIERALQKSNDPVLALGSVFSKDADSHLVAVQMDENDPKRNALASSDYETQAINIVNKDRKVTGASFIVFSGALKSSSGLTAKSSIVEDGIMVQISQDKMMALRKSLEKMENVDVPCGPIGTEDPDERILIRWVEQDLTLNSGRSSTIDDQSLSGVPSIRLHASRDFVSEKSAHFIRWTEVFLLSHSMGSTDFDPPDPMGLATGLAKAICASLTPHLKPLKAQGQTPLAVRIFLDPDKLGYEAGSGGKVFPQEFLNFLDDTLIPILHGGELTAIPHSKATLELVFHILDC